MENLQINSNELNKIMDDYFETFGVKPVEVDIELTNSISDSYAKLRPDHKEKDSEMFKEKKMDSDNGVVVPPNYLDGKFVILLNRNSVIENIRNDNLTWIGTIAHELTHVIDFKDYAKITGFSSYDEISNGDILFLLWTEFNAKTKGYYFTRKYTFNDLHENEDEQIEEIVNYELPAQLQLMYNEYNSTNNAYQQAYYVVHYLGRLYTLQQIFPNYFDEDFIEEHLISNKWMHDLYNFFAKNANLEDAYMHFDELERLTIKYFGLFAN